MRPCKLTPELQAALCESLASGVDRKNAALKAGINERTLRRWLKAGREGGGAEFVSFLSAVKKAEAEAIAMRVRQINSAAMSGSWQAAAWWLERRHPDLYGSERKRLRELADEVKELARTVAALPRPAPPPRYAEPPGRGGGFQWDEETPGSEG